MTTLLALLVLSRDPYAGFQARYRPFAQESLYPRSLDQLRHGKDVTSLLYPGRFRLVEILRRAKIPARFEDASVGLLLRLGREEWAVNLAGVVLVDGHAARLTEDDFTSLRDEILDLLPDTYEERIAVNRLLTAPKGKPNR